MHMQAVIRSLAQAPAPLGEIVPEKTALLLRELRKYGPREVVKLFEPPPAPPPSRPEGKSKYVRDHRHPYTEGGGLKQRVMKAVLETIICQNCRRAFLSRRRDAKTCSSKCRTALHRKSK
jgi:hypothetical protein